MPWHGLIAALVVALTIACSSDTPEPAPSKPRMADFTVVEKRYVPVGQSTAVRFTIILRSQERTIDTSQTDCWDVQIGSVLPWRCR